MRRIYSRDVLFLYTSEIFYPWDEVEAVVLGENTRCAEASWNGRNLPAEVGRG